MLRGDNARHSCRWEHAGERVQNLLCQQNVRHICCICFVKMYMLNARNDQPIARHGALKDSLIFISIDFTCTLYCLWFMCITHHIVNKEKYLPQSVNACTKGSGHGSFCCLESLMHSRQTDRQTDR